MIFTGNNLRLVRRALDDALGEAHNLIATCPDVGEYAEDIEALEAVRAAYQRLIDAIDRKHPNLFANSSQT